MGGGDGEVEGLHVLCGEHGEVGGHSSRDVVVEGEEEREERRRVGRRASSLTKGGLG